VISAAGPIRPTVHGRNAFDKRVIDATGGELRGESIDTVQVNIGLKCNLACHHCHVESSPKRTEEMDWPTMQHVLNALRASGAHTLDITGGAPEMNHHFRRLVRNARNIGAHVMVRTNLTIMLERGYEDLPEFFRDHRVHLIASLPCYMKENVNRQRGRHVFEESVQVLQRLNGIGYGIEEGLPIDLVYNPLGPSLPPAQDALQADYRRVLLDQFGIRFSRLIAITNVPIGRFVHDLRRQGRAEEYLRLLRDSFNPATVNGLMCRHQLHVGWDGTLYDCDFNFAIGLRSDQSTAGHIREFEPASWRRRRITTANHCFGCTAGRGSSCGGELTPACASKLDST
jgi:radical SAM/Cys-rich protein